jgi:hypothetical protein
VRRVISAVAVATVFTVAGGVPLAHADSLVPTPTNLVVGKVSTDLGDSMTFATASESASAGATGIVFVAGSDPVPAPPANLNQAVSPLGTIPDADNNVKAIYNSLMCGDPYSPCYVAAYAVGSDGMTLSAPAVEELPIITPSDTIPGPITPATWTATPWYTVPLGSTDGSIDLTWRPGTDIASVYLTDVTGPGAVAPDPMTPPPAGTWSGMFFTNNGVSEWHPTLNRVPGTPMTITVFAVDKAHTHYTRSVIVIRAGLGSNATVSVQGPAKAYANAVVRYTINARQDLPGMKTAQPFTPVTVQTSVHGGKWISRWTGMTDVNGIATWTTAPMTDGQAVRVVLANTITSVPRVTTMLQATHITIRSAAIYRGRSMVLRATVVAPKASIQVVQRCTTARIASCRSYRTVRAVGGKIATPIQAPHVRGYAYYYRIVVPSKSIWAPAAYSSLLKLTAR